MIKKNLILLISLIFLSISLCSSVLISDQGTNVKVISTGEKLENGDLTIIIYDAISSGNLIFNSTFENVIINGSWNLMINPHLEYGKSYWKDYRINGENLAFDGEDRIEFQSPGGIINNISFFNLSLIGSCPEGSSIRLVYTNGSVECETDNVGASENLTNYALKNQSENFSGNITTTGTGFFGFLGSLVNRITSLFVQNIDFIGNINGTGNITTTGRIGIGTETPSNALDVRGTINASGIIFYNNGTPITTLNETGLINSVNTTANIQNLLNSTGIYTYNYNQTTATYNLYNDIWLSTYNSTYATYLYGLRNETLDTFNNYNSTWDNNWVNQFAYNHTSSTIEILGTNFTTLTNNLASINTTANIQTLINGTNANFANVEFNGGWTNGGASIINGNIFARAAYFYNITGLDTTTLKINGSLLPTTGWDDTFDIGSSSLRWKNLYLSGDARINGTIYYGNEGIPITALNETGLINSVNSSTQAALTINTTANINNLYPVNTTTNIQTLLAGTNISQYAFNQTLETFNTYNSTWDNRDLIASVNMTANIQNLVNAIYVPYEGASANVNLGIYNLTTTGNVGIGTTNPTYKLVTKRADDGIVALFVTDNVTNIQGLYLSTSITAPYITKLDSSGSHDGSFVFATGGTERMRIENSVGNIGIGTASPDAKLDISTPVDAVGSFAVQQWGLLNEDANYNMRLNASVSAGLTKYIFSVRNAGDLYDNNLVLDSGKVGIGTASPTARLEVMGLDTETFQQWTLGAISNDPGNYMNLTYAAAQNTFIFGTSAGRNIAFNNEGNVGIGTTNPTVKLQVEGSQAGNGFAVLINNTDTGATELASLQLKTGYSTKVWQWFTRGGNLFAGVEDVADYLVIQNSTGNVGIGTASPYGKLGVNGSIRIITSDFVFNTTGTNIGILTGATTGNTFGIIQVGILGDSVGGNLTLNPYGGNVGIGTTTPGQKLVSIGDINYAGGDSITDATIKNFRVGALHYTNAEEPLSVLYAQSTNLISRVAIGGGTSYTNTATQLEFYTAGDTTTLTGTERMRINKDGNVGIGTTSPHAGLTINKGNNTVPSLAFGSSSWGWQFYERADNGDLQIDATNNNVNTSTLYLDRDTGNVGIGTTTPNTKLFIKGAHTSGYGMIFAESSNNAILGLSAANGDARVRFQKVSGTDLWLIGNDLSDDSFDIESASGKKFTVLQGGNVGIGTASPAYQLQVNSSINLTAGEHFIAGFGLSDGSVAIGYYANGTDENYGYIRSRHSVDLGFGAGATNHLYIKQEGNVGIGTTSPTVKLDVNGGAIIRNSFSIPGLSTTGTYRYGPDNSPIWASDEGSYTNNNAVAPDGTTTASTLTLTAGGGGWDLYQNFGSMSSGTVYTVSSYVKLGNATNFCIVVNNAAAWDTVGGKCWNSTDGLSTTKWTRVAYTFTAPASNQVNVHIGAHLQTLTQQTAGTVYSWNWEITTGTTTWMNSPIFEGNVGIGTTNPGAKLEVESTGANYATTPTLLVQDTSARGSLTLESTTDNPTDLLFKINGRRTFTLSGRNSGESYITNMFTWGADGLTAITALVIAQNTGYIGIGALTPSVALDVLGDIEYTGTIVDVSDIRLKNNIINLTGSLNKLSNLQGIKFNMNNSNLTEFGFSAQEVQKVFPELVSITDKENGYLGVSYVGLIPVMTESIKELKNENGDLQEENTKMQESLCRLGATEWC